MESIATSMNRAGLRHGSFNLRVQQRSIVVCQLFEEPWIRANYLKSPLPGSHRKFRI
jgi:hypothetical protein